MSRPEMSRQNVETHEELTSYYGEIVVHSDGI